MYSNLAQKRRRLRVGIAVRSPRLGRRQDVGALLTQQIGKQTIANNITRDGREEAGSIVKEQVGPQGITFFDGAVIGADCLVGVPPCQVWGRERDLAERGRTEERGKEQREREREAGAVSCEHRKKTTENNNQNKHAK